MVRQRFGFEGRTVLALGRLATNKGYDLLIDAFSVLAQRVPDARLRLALGGESLDAQEEAIHTQLKQQVADLGIVDKVEFTGFITG